MDQALLSSVDCIRLAMSMSCERLARYQADTSTLVAHGIIVKIESLI